ncbi:hypothetical protein BDR06DRAFT_983226 [Suillus hirtellus]|nr:hypothetical protein BDR06DRAFT_983226 [Suillus hirtellus]
MKPFERTNKKSAHFNAPLMKSKLECILDVIGAAWAQSMKETYGASLLVFHVFCNINDVSEEKHCPIVCSLLLDFLCSCAGLRAWHLLHGMEWNIPPNKLKAILDRATVSVPKQLDLNVPLNAAVFACLMTMFYVVARLGEFTVSTIKEFDIKKYITRARVSNATD